MKLKLFQLLNSHQLKKWYLGFSLLIIFSAIACLFWYNELIYQLPTPVPKDYREIKIGTNIIEPNTVKGKKPRFVHFFNPDCPCSRFNMKHFKTLVKKYRSEVDFEIVALVEDNQYTVQEVQDKFDLDLPVTFDTSLAAVYGVYSTPQAVIMNNQKLFYRGNYNKSRYCTDPKSNYAEMAIDSLLRKKHELKFDNLAFNAYGCQLPGAKN